MITGDKDAKKDALRDIILKLHEGLTPEEAKDRFENEVGNVTSTEIAELEQSLIDEGLSPEEIKKFCNVHALIFESALQQAAMPETAPSHPVYLFKKENREIEKLTAALKNAADKAEIMGLLTTLRGVDTHYERKEQLLFPFLEKKGFMGPSKVMWGKDNEIRDLMKEALNNVDSVTPESLGAFRTDTLEPLIEELNGMAFKEENILFPTSLEKLDAGAILKVLAGDAEGLRQYGRETGITMCGLQAAAVALDCGLPEGYEGALLHYSRSGDRDNDYTQSVSYAAVLLCSGPNPIQEAL
jgi:DUF438 domain-containing protein